MADYLTVCPRCGGPLTPVLASPDTAPWLCAACSRGWWPAELSQDARAAYRPDYGDHGVDQVAVDIAGAREADLDAAIGRGTSVLPEHLADAPVDQLQQVADHLDLHPDFAADIDQAIADRS